VFKVDNSESDCIWHRNFSCRLRESRFCATRQSRDAAPAALAAAVQRL